MGARSAQSRKKRRERAKENALEHSNQRRTLIDDALAAVLCDAPEQLLFPQLSDASKPLANDATFLELARHFCGMRIHGTTETADEPAKLLVGPEFTLDQIWQQVHLRQRNLVSGLHRAVGRFCTRPDLDVDGTVSMEDSAGDSDAPSDGEDSQSESDAESNKAPSEQSATQPDEETPDPLSTAERTKQKMDARIAELESEIMTEKPWAMRGEVSAQARPVNSLLEENLEVDVALKPAPVITHETTVSLEDMIRARIRDENFDNVERRVDASALLGQVFDPNKDVDVDDSKPQQSLAQVYEAEYQRQTGGAAPTARDTALAAQHAEIDALYNKLCYHLDALSNQHFVPKPVEATLQVVTDTNVPAIQMEEALPVHVSSAATAAPQDVLPVVRKDVRDRAEMDRAEKKRVRARDRATRARDAARQKEQRALAEKVLGTAGPQQLSSSEVKKLHRESVRTGKEDALRSLRKQSNVTIAPSAEPRSRQRATPKARSS